MKIIPEIGDDWPTSLFSDAQMNIPYMNECRSRRTMTEILKIPQRIRIQKSRRSRRTLLKIEFMPFKS